MPTKDDVEWAHKRTVDLRHLLKVAGDDPILVPQLRERLEDAERELKEIEAKYLELVKQECSQAPTDI